MISFIEHAKRYAVFHQNPTTRYIHIAGVLFLFLSLMILLGFVRVIIQGVLNVSLADIAVVALLIYYTRLNWRLALTLVPIFIVLLFVAGVFTYEGPDAFGLWSFLCILLLGCVLQFIGYFIEGKRPDAVDMLCQILIAPLCIIAALFFKLGRMQALKEAVHGKGSKETF